MKSLFEVAVAILLMVSPLAVAQAPLGQTLEGLLEHARANPELAAMQSEATAAEQRIYPAGALPDPTFRVELQNITNAGSDSRPNLLPARVGSTKYTLMQTLPLWGKRDLRREVAEAELSQARARVSTTWADVAAGLKVGFARYYLAVESEALSLEVLELMQRLERVALSRYEGGLAPQQDVIRAQVEVSSMRSELLTLESEREAARASINMALGRSPDAVLARPVRLRPVPSPAALEAARLAERLVGGAPQLSVEDARIAAAEKNRTLTERNRYPDVTAGISPIQMGSRLSEWELMFEVSIPLQQQSRRHQEAEAKAMVDASVQRRRALAFRLAAEVQENAAALASARRIELLTTSSLLPQAEATLQSALAGYESGKVDFATLLDAQRAIRKARQDRLKAQVEAQVRLAAIESILGEDL